MQLGGAISIKWKCFPVGSATVGEKLFNNQTENAVLLSLLKININQKHVWLIRRLRCHAFQRPVRQFHFYELPSSRADANGCFSFTSVIALGLRFFSGYSCLCVFGG